MDHVSNSLHAPTLLACSAPEPVARLTRTIFLAIAKDRALNTAEQERLLACTNMQSASRKYFSESRTIKSAQLVLVSHHLNILQAIIVSVLRSSRGTLTRDPGKSPEGYSPLEIMQRDGEVRIATIHRFLDALFRG